MPAYYPQYDKLLDQINAMYDELDEWAALNNVNLADYYPTEYEAVKSVPRSVITKNRAGDVIGTDFYIQTPQEFNPPAVIDSNVPNPYYSGSNGNYGGSGYRMNGSGGGTSPNVFSSGAKKVGTGTKVLTVAGNVLSTVGAASLGAQLGKAINANFGGSFAWTERDWYNWTDTLDPLDKAVFRTLFGIEGDATTMYLPEEMLALEYMELQKMGAFDELLVPENPEPVIGNYSAEIVGITLASNFQAMDNPPSWTPAKYVTNSVSGNEPVYVFKMFRSKMSSSANDYDYIWASKAPFTVSMTRTYTDGGKPYTFTISSDSSVVAGKRVYYGKSNVMTARDDYRPVDNVGGPSTFKDGDTILKSSSYSDIAIASALILSTGYIIGTGVPGITNDPRATQVDPNLITGTTTQQVLDSLKQNYPQLFDGSIEEDVPQEDGSTKKITYIPVPWPSKDPNGNPITGTPSQTNPQVDPLTETTDAIKDLIDTITDFFTNPPNTGTGDGPTAVVPVGEASSLWKIYNPTQAQVDAFGSWLWSSNFVEQLKKLFNDPMQAIIGIHKVFATPSIGGTATIKVGYLDSEVPSAWVNEQYTTINCGTVNLREYFGNVFDYAPYTKVSLYLPFIGIVDLDVADVMRSSISITYHVDVLTGACLADVKVIRDGCGGVLYQYSGSAIVTYPVSSGNYMGMVAGVLSVASGIAGTVLTGGALAPALIGGAVGASHLHTDVSHSGAFSGCAGAMGAKKPYLIISRPQVALANNYEHFTGRPANAHVTIANCSGLTKVKSVYVKSISRATDEEKDMIEAQLKAGVLV